MRLRHGAGLNEAENFFSTANVPQARWLRAKCFQISCAYEFTPTRDRPIRMARAGVLAACRYFNGISNTFYRCGNKHIAAQAAPSQVSPSVVTLQLEPRHFTVSSFKRAHMTWDPTANFDTPVKPGMGTGEFWFVVVPSPS